VPPLSDLAVTDGSWGVVIIIIIVVIVIIVIVIVIVTIIVSRLGVTNDDHSVVELIVVATAIGETEDTGGVLLEFTASSIEGDGERVGLELLKHVVDATGDLSVVFDISVEVIVVVLALLFCSATVSVVRVSHNTLLLHEVPGVAHPTSFTSPAAVVLIELGAGWLVSECAIDRLLLREADSGLVLSDSDGTLKGSGGGESPAGTTATLVLHGAHAVSGSPIDVHGFGCKLSVLVLAVLLVLLLLLGKLQGSFLLLSLFKTEDDISLFLSSVGQPVVLESEGVFLAAGVSFAVSLTDEVVKIVVEFLSHLVLGGGSGSLVEGGHVLAELGVFVPLVEG